MEMTQKVRRVDWIEKTGELGALLLEAKLIKQMKPAYNRLLRNVTKLYSIRMSAQMNDLPWLRIESIDDIDPADLEFMYGVFKTKKAAKELINNLASEFKICPKLLGIEKGKGKCFAYHVSKCTGVCFGQEKHELHHLRLRQAMIGHKIKSWPYEGRIGIKEINPTTHDTEVHIFEHWCHLETVSSEAELELAATAHYEKKFDIDFYRLIQKSLLSHQDIMVLKAA